MLDIRNDPETNDIAELEDGDLPMVDGNDAVDQYLGQFIGLFLGEWFLDESEGTPYHDDVFVKNPDPALLNAVFKKRITDCPNVIELLSFSSSLDNASRALSVLGKARTTSGEVTFDETLILGEGA